MNPSTRAKAEEVASSAARYFYALNDDDSSIHQSEEMLVAVIINAILPILEQNRELREALKLVSSHAVHSDDPVWALVPASAMNVVAALLSQPDGKETK